MNTLRITRSCTLTALVMAICTTIGLNQHVAAQQPDSQDGVEVLTRGPVHEAFAETVTFDPEPGIVVAKAPPPAIEELPPDQRPEGDNVAWIPGYWAWDDERNDFLWVSGVWRALPPGRQWVPGYWGQSANGAQWTSGYWADANASEIEYLPEPPTTAETGPNIAAPSPDQNWMPGSWVWQQGRYLWSPGYWATVQPDWDWVPAHYVWAPRGYVYVDGYWDYSVGRRGVLFAPVYFAANVYAQRGFSYSPAVVINPAVFGNQLFLRPNYQHYYFGDYYGSKYSSTGFHPWFSYNSSRFGYDPIYAQQRWQHRGNREWNQNLQANFQNRMAHQNARPPRTWAAQQALIASSATSADKSFVIATPLDQITKSKDSPLRFQPVDQTERQQLGQQAQGVHKFRELRQKLETKQADASDQTPGQKARPATAKLSRSPIVAKSSDQLGKDYAPPKTYETPQPDPKVEPKQRVARSGDAQPPYTVNRQPIDTQQQPKALPRDTSPTSRQNPAAAPTLAPKVEPQQPQSQRRVDKPAVQPQPQPKVDKPATQPQPQPKADKPAAQSQSQRRVDRPAAAPTLAPKVEPQQPPSQRKAYKPANEPAAPLQSQRKVDRPAPQTQSQRRANQPAAQSQSQRKVDLPAAQTQSQPRGESRKAPNAGSNAPPKAGTNQPANSGSQEKPKDESNEKPKG